MNIKSKFNHSELDKVFSNIEKREKSINRESISYVIKDPKTGSHIAELWYFEEEFNEWNIIVDNFPRKRKAYKSSLPCKTFEEFKNDVLRTRIELIELSNELNVTEKISQDVSLEKREILLNK